MVARTRVLGTSARVALAVLLAAVVALLVVIAFGGDDEVDVGTDPAAEPTSTTTTSPSESPEPSAEPGADPLTTDQLHAAADQAAEDGLVPMVTDGSSGFAVTAASYDGGTWTLVLAADGGPVTVVQRAGAAAGLVRDAVPDAAQGADVDLDRWGLGTWSSWTSESGAALSADLPAGGVAVVGPDDASVRAVTRTLLTYEYLRGGEQD